MKTYAKAYRGEPLTSEKLSISSVLLQIDLKDKICAQIPRLYQRIDSHTLAQQIEFGDQEDANETIYYKFERGIGLRRIELFTTYIQNIDCVFPSADYVRAVIKTQVEEKFSQSRRQLADNLYNDMLIIKEKWGYGFDDTIKFALQHHSDAISELELEVAAWRQAPGIRRTFTLKQYHDYQVNGEKRPTFKYTTELKVKSPPKQAVQDISRAELIEYTRLYKSPLPELDQKIIAVVKAESLAEAFRVAAMDFMENQMRQSPY